MIKFFTLALTITCVTSDTFHDQLENIRKIAEYIDVSNEAVTQTVKLLQKKSDDLITDGTQNEVDAVTSEHRRISNRQHEIKNKINDLNQLKKYPVPSIQEVDEINKKTDKMNERQLNIARRRAFHRNAMDAWKLLRRNNLETLQELESNIESRDSDENKLNAMNLMRELNIQSASDLLTWYKSDKGSLQTEIESLDSERSKNFVIRTFIETGAGLLMKYKVNSVDEFEDAIRNDFEEIRSQQLELKSRFDNLIPRLQGRAK